MKNNNNIKLKEKRVGKIFRSIQIKYSKIIISLKNILANLKNGMNLVHKFAVEW